jgi:serine/threonine protein phosphatase PrpC
LEGRELVVGSKDLESACERLIAAANASGGTDNITVALVQFMGD